MRKVKITANGITVSATLNKAETAERIWNALPITGTVNTWGDEIYFEIPVTMELEPDARAEVAVGELGYWPTGNAFCIFFGPTPMSADDKPRAASAVNIFGRIEGDTAVLKQIPAGAEIEIAKKT